MKRFGQRLLNICLFLLGITRRQPVVREWQPAVTVVIPAFNEEGTIADTVRSVWEQTHPIKEIIVADDCSQDRTAEIVRGLSGVKLVATPQNTGTKSQALNFGLQYVKTEIVITLDADTVLDKDAIRQIVPALADGKTLSASGFVIPQRVVSFWERARLVQYLYYLGLNKKTQSHWGCPIVASGCFSAFNVKLLFELGGFPAGNMAEDMALTWKGLLSGKKVKFVPRAVCYPKDPQNWKQYRGQVTRWYRGFFQCVSQHKRKIIKNPRLAFFVSWYTLSGILNPVLALAWLAYLLAVLLSGSIQPFHLFLSLWFLLELAVVMVVVVTEAARHHKVRAALSGLLPFWAAMPVESYLWAFSFVQECLLGRKLSKWEKGH